jgi:plastocyanin
MGEVRTLWWRILLIVLAGVGLAGCGGDDDTGTTRVGMLDNVYTRDVTRVPVGTEVVFRNQGKTVHNAVAVNGLWSTADSAGSDVLQPGQSAAVTVDRPGVYRYYCTLHGTRDGDGMYATLVVGDVPYTADPDTEPQPAVAEASGTVRRVPRDHRSIQAAVDAADPGDLVLIDPGVYREQVKVDTPSLVLRGTDRNTVVIDGEFTRPNAISITADGVAVENLTVRNARLNGVFWTGVTGYRASSVTAVNNEVYGIYAFDSVDGLLEDSYASGSADAGFYIGQCDPCNAVIRGVVAEHNGLGYSGTNASGNVHLVESTWRYNVAGIVPNTLDTELMPPATDVDIVGNLVYGNGVYDAPTLEIQWPTFGGGVIAGGTEDVRIERNRIVGNALHGVLVSLNLSEQVWIASGNVVRDNVVAGSGRADLALSGPAGAGNCFSGNDAGRTVPVGLQVFQSCDGPRLPWRWDLSTVTNNLGYVAEAAHGIAPVNAPRDQPYPPPQPQLPGGAAAPVAPAFDVYDRVDLYLSAIDVPDAPADLPPDHPEEVLVSGLPLLTTGFWSVFFGLYAYMLPIILLAAWTAVALWDLARRAGGEGERQRAGGRGHEGKGELMDVSRGATIAWIAVILLVPFVGVMAYLLLRADLPGWLRGTLVGGGLAAYVLIMGIGAAVGGVV